VGVEVIRRGGLTLTAFDPRELRLVARVRGGTAAPLAPLEAATMIKGVCALLDGPMFDLCAADAAALHELPDAEKYRRAGCYALRYGLFDPDANLAVPSARPRDGGTLAVVDGRAVGHVGWQVPPRAAFAAQGAPLLVFDGRVVATNDFRPNAERSHRCALAILGDGRVAFAYAYADMVSFAELLREAGVLWAVYTDGGGSAYLGACLPPRGATGPLTLQKLAGSGEGRRVPLWLACVTRMPPAASLAASLFALAVASGVVGLAVAARRARR
jgi:hypothetical protein